jgi:hypothetical protein
LEGRVTADDRRRGRAVTGSERSIVDDPIFEIYEGRFVSEGGRGRRGIGRGCYWGDGGRSGRMRSVEEMLFGDRVGRFGVDRDGG